MNNRKTTIKPVFKYIGGKSWLKKQLQYHCHTILSCNNNITKYCEPFSGGLGAFLSMYPVLKEYNIEQIILNDVNKPIINFYNLIKKDYSIFFQKYIELEREFGKTITAEARGLHRTKEKEKLKVLLSDANDFFRQTRVSFNKDVLNSKENELGSENAALFLFLQKHSFNGIYRENSKGEYNTPFNWEVGQTVFSVLEADIKKLANLFNQSNVFFTCEDYQNLENDKNTLFYLDPPYLNEKKGENRYNKNIFSINEQKQLINFIKNNSFLYSNHDSLILMELFNDIVKEGFEVFKVNRSNIISSSKGTRGNKKSEMLVKKVF